ncbi:MAG: hypothetical protein ACP5K7_00700 [Verrucomicrobiia bacterium]
MDFTFVIIHYHLRPGGVRRVIELATPQILKTLRRNCRVILATGEEPPDNWLDQFKAKLDPLHIELQLFAQPSFGYTSESGLTPDELKSNILTDINRLFKNLSKENSLIWFHNPALGRNFILTDEIIKAAIKKEITLIAHHHDWWFENRWQRYEEMQQCGYATLEHIARVTFPASTTIKHCAINFQDAAMLKKFLGAQSGWLPNPVEIPRKPSANEILRVKKWIRNQLGDDGKVWLMPTRVLRRKNIAEGLLLKNWFCPDAWLITTAKESSSNELDYAARLIHATNTNRWKLKLGILSNPLNNVTDKSDNELPDIPAMYAASEVVLLTSIQEGFGLAYIEAAIFKRPLIARILPNLEKDFKICGLEFPQSYRDILIPPTLFNWYAESQRQKLLFENWLSAIPNKFRDYVKLPDIVRTPLVQKPIPFARLTLSAQLEALTHSPQNSFKQCVKINPFLKPLAKKVASNSLELTRITENSLKWISLDIYAENFWKIVHSKPKPKANVADKLLTAFIKQKLSEKFIYPLLLESRQSY